MNHFSVGVKSEFDHKLWLIFIWWKWYPWQQKSSNENSVYKNYAIKNIHFLLLFVFDHLISLVNFFLIAINQSQFWQFEHPRSTISIICYLWFFFFVLYLITFSINNSWKWMKRKLLFQWLVSYCVALIRKPYIYIRIISLFCNEQNMNQIQLDNIYKFLRILTLLMFQCKPILQTLLWQLMINWLILPTEFDCELLLVNNRMDHLPPNRLHRFLFLLLLFSN